MISPINATATVVSTEEMGGRNYSGYSPGSSEAAPLDTGTMAVAKLDESGVTPKYKRSEGEKPAHKGKADWGEIRRILVEDGKVTINVYDSNGKLLRKTPPGYLPLGEEGFDITV